jgi:ABC-type uncharacterized transport system substrate-binding protein
MWCRTCGGIATLTVSLLVALLTAAAQPAREMPRIGVLASGTLPNRGVEALRQGLRDLGYVEGQTVRLEVRASEGPLEQYLEPAAELVRLNVDVLVAAGINAILAAQHATRTIPIVMAAQGGRDPVAAGLIASLARPGGNMTGLTLMTPELTGKRLELLKEAVPGLSRVALLLDAGHVSRHAHLDDHTTAARLLGLQLQPLDVRGPADFAEAFQAARQGQVQALIMVQSPLMAVHRARLAELALASRLPTMVGETGYAEAGGLMDYGPNIPESWRRAAVYVDKILKGAHPADLPVEQPTRFELVINLKTAKELGLTIPPSLLVQADKVIQ